MGEPEAEELNVRNDSENVEEEGQWGIRTEGTPEEQEEPEKQVPEDQRARELERLDVRNHSEIMS